MLLLFDSIGEHLSGALWQVAIFSALSDDPQLRIASPLINMTFFLFHLAYWTMEKHRPRVMTHWKLPGLLTPPMNPVERDGILTSKWI